MLNRNVFFDAKDLFISRHIVPLGITTCLQVSIDAWKNSEYHERHSNVGLAQN